MLKIAQLLHTKNISKAVIRCYLIRPDYKKSFQYQILNYFQNIDDARTASEQYEVSAQVRKAVTKNNFSLKEFQSIREQINNLSHGHKLNEELINTIDIRCLKLIDSLTHSQILMLLNSLLKILSHNTLMETQFYKASMERLFQALDCELLSQQEIVQLLFFISLKKEEARSYIHYLKFFLPDMKDMDLIEKCITAEAFYKTSVKLDQSQCRILEDLLSERPEELISNTYLLVALCKAIRLSKPTSQLNLTNLSNAILSKREPFNIMVAVHILSLYAEALIHEPIAVGCLVKDCMETFAQNRWNLRLKDIDRFLWSISHLGFFLKEDEKLLLMNVIEKRLKELKTKENVGLLVNSLLSLHTLECWNPKIIENCFEERVFEPVYYEKFHWKIRSRLHLFIQQISVELNVDVPEALKKEIQIAYTVPEEIDTVAKMLNSLTDKNIVQGVLVHCPVKGLHIPGISLATESCLYHIDLLNNFTCLRNTSIPHGLMQLKKRLLTHLNFHHILLEGDLLTKDPDKIQSIVQKQIYKNKV